MRSFVRARRQAGFSFIEILVVMGIIAVLAGLGIAIVNIFIRKSPQFETDATLRKVKATVGAWQLRFQMLPPVRLADIHNAASIGQPIKHTGNSENEGIEALYQAFYWPGFGTDAELDGDKELANTDDDRLAQAPNNSDRGPELREIVDGWGNPLVYFVNTVYAQADQNPPTYMLKNDTSVQPRPWREEAGGFVNPNSFQVFSMGEDGQPNTEDDRKGW